MNLNQFKTQALAGGGARANLFEVEGQIGPNGDGFELRDRFEAWSNALNAHESNLTQAYQGNFISVPFFQDWKITWLKRDGQKANGRTYRMVGCWPQAISAIEVAADTNDSLAEFSVTMNYQWWMSNATT